MTQLVDLADEFDLTTAEARELCEQIGVPAPANDAEFGDHDAAQFRQAAEARREARAEQMAARSGDLPLAPLVSHTDFTRVPESWHEAARIPPPPAPGSQGVERQAVMAVLVAGLSLVVSLLTGLCGVAFALVPIGISVRAKHAMAANATSGAGLVVLARVGAVIAIVIALGVSWVAFTGNIDRLPTLAILDVFVPGDLRAADSLQVGDCVLEPDSLPGATELEVVQVVPCADAHDVEYFALLEAFGITPVNDLDEFPGEESLRSVMLAECTPLWEEFVGSTAGASELDVAVSFPTEKAWRSGDRLLLCGVAAADGSSLEGSMAGAGR